LSQATIRFDNAALLPAHDESFHEVCVAAGGISGVPKVVTGVKARWGARIAGGGCTLELFRVPAGMNVSFR
jgi:cytochrome c5